MWNAWHAVITQKKKELGATDQREHSTLLRRPKLWGSNSALVTDPCPNWKTDPFPHGSWRSIHFCRTVVAIMAFYVQDRRTCATSFFNPPGKHFILCQWGNFHFLSNWNRTSGSLGESHLACESPRAVVHFLSNESGMYWPRSNGVEGEKLSNESEQPSPTLAPLEGHNTLPHWSHLLFLVTVKPA